MSAIADETGRQIGRITANPCVTGHLSVAFGEHIVQ
jgi:hypothetical protein